MSNMNWVDVILIIIFLFSMLVGFAKGFITQAVSLVAVIAAFIIAITFSSTLAELFAKTDIVQQAASKSSEVMGLDTTKHISYVAIAVSFGLLFFLTLLAGTIVGYIISIPFQTGILGFSNRLFGALFGLVRGFIINLVIIFVVQLTSMGTYPWWVESRIVAAYQPAVDWLGRIVSPQLDHLKEQFSRTFHDVTSNMGDLKSSYLRQ